MSGIQGVFGVFPKSNLSKFLISGEEETTLSSEDRKKRPRTAFTAAQIKALENEFEKNKYLSVSKRMQLSKQQKLTETQVSYFNSFPFPVV